jgi:hypothetical protein
MGLSWIQNRYTAYSTKQSEEFNTASRSVKPGLIASGIVSAWTWAATLLQSSTVSTVSWFDIDSLIDRRQVAYNYGIAGPFWYAAGATVQILVFSILACKVKQNAPRCHTYLEIINARYGRVAHLVFMVFAFITNILVGSQLLLGGSAVVTALTGMNVYAAIFLIPVGKYRLSPHLALQLTENNRCLCVCNPWRSSSDLPVRLLSYLDLNDYHPLLHVSRLRLERTHRLTRRHVRSSEERCCLTTYRRQP